MYRACIEADTGDYLTVRNDSNRMVGKAALAFLGAMSSYCIGSNDEETQNWFSQFEKHSPKPVCSLLEPLDQVYYVGDWNYTEDEYDIFIKRSPEFANFPEDRFKNAVRQVNEKWTSTTAVLNSIDALLSLLDQVLPVSTYWYNPEHTIPDLRYIQRTIVFLQERGAEKIRIKFV